MKRIGRHYSAPPGKYRASVSWLARASAVNRDTITISSADTIVIGTTGRQPSTIAPAGVRVMMSAPNADQTAERRPAAATNTLLNRGDHHHRERGPQRARQGAPLGAVSPEQRRDQQWRQRGISGKGVLGRHLEDRLRHSERNHVRHERDDDDEDAAGHDLHRLAKARLPSIEGEHVLREHRRERQDL